MCAMSWCDLDMTFDLAYVMLCYLSTEISNTIVSLLYLLLESWCLHLCTKIEIGVIPSVCLSVFCPFVCLSKFPFPHSNSKTVCPIKFKLDREIDHHHCWVPFEIGVIPSVRLSVNISVPGLLLENTLSS